METVPLAPSLRRNPLNGLALPVIVKLWLLVMENVEVVPVNKSALSKETEKPPSAREPLIILGTIK